MNSQSNAFKAKKEAVEKVKKTMKKYAEKYGGPGSGRKSEGGDSSDSNDEKKIMKDMSSVQKKIDGLKSDMKNVLERNKVSHPKDLTGNQKRVYDDLHAESAIQEGKLDDLTNKLMKK